MISRSFTLQSALSWLANNALLVGTAFLLAFIPLYPKLPLFDIIPGYIVRVRLEDFFVLLVAGIWAWQVWQGKIAWRSRVTYAVLAYLAVGLLSSLSAMFITQTVPLTVVHIGKTFLHFVRYIEYFSLLFITMAAIRTREHLKIVLAVILLTAVAITVYGYGQKHWYWPVYSTMNREFSKGVRLVLTEHARVQSTFGGHYDLSAYLVLILPILMTGWYFIKQRWLQIVFGVSFVAGIWLLIVAGSRSSFGGFIAAGLMVIALAVYHQYSTWTQRLLMGLTHSMLFALISGVMMLSFGTDMYDRFKQTLEGYPALHTAYNAAIDTSMETKDTIVSLFITEDQSKRIADITRVEKPENAITVDEAESVLTRSDERPVPALPGDVYEDIPDIVTIATMSAEGNLEYIDVERERTYSDAAYKYGLSMAIRFDTLWPQALQGFYTNPLLGSGYATLTKETVGQFTEADSTDNNFLRTLGETGLLGFIMFYGTVVLVSYRAWTLYRTKQDWLIQIFAIAFLAGTVGLLINAVLIDVFAASKVAFTFWALAGIIVAMSSLDNQQTSNQLAAALQQKSSTHHKKSAPRKKRVASKRSKKITAQTS